MRPIAMVALVAVSGCAYEHVSGRDHADALQPYVYESRGWDSGLALGLATEKARAQGWKDDPDAVDMDCYTYGIKPAAIIAIEAVAGLLLSRGHTGPGLAIAAGAIPVAFWPNCVATIGYRQRRAALAPARAVPVAPPAEATEPVDLPMHLFQQTVPKPPAEPPPAAVPPSD
jgi:hypothetical protein